MRHPEELRNKLILMISAGLGLMFLLLVSVSLLIPSYSDPGADDTPDLTVKTKPRPGVNPSGTPAQAFVKSLRSTLPGEWAGAPVREDLVAPVRVGDCKTTVIATTGLSRTWKKKGSVSRLKVAVFPAGLAGQAMSECGHPDVVDRDGIKMRRFSDVVVAVSTESDPERLMQEAAKAVVAGLSGQCYDPAAPPDQATRNPYHHGEFVGLLEPREVKPSVTVPAPRAYGEPVPLERVRRPKRPDFPFYPAALPEKVKLPDYPAVPQRPETKKTVQIQVDDPAGPGCGWAFTGLSKPVFSAAKVKEENDRLIKETRDSLDDGVSAFVAAEKEWDKAHGEYLATVERYRAYAEEVSAVAVQWDAQREAQIRYRRALRRYNQGLDAKREFEDTQRRAEARFNEEMKACKDEPEPSPTDDHDNGDEHHTPDPEMTGPPCPPERPKILDEAAPQVPVKPSPPPDPRPEGER